MNLLLVALVSLIMSCGSVKNLNLFTFPGQKKKKNKDTLQREKSLRSRLKGVTRQLQQSRCSIVMVILQMPLLRLFCYFCRETSIDGYRRRRFSTFFIKGCFATRVLGLPRTGTSVRTFRDVPRRKGQCY